VSPVDRGPPATDFTGSTSSIPAEAERFAEAICNELVHVINQPRNAWTFSLDLRSYWQWRPRVAAARKKP